MATKSKTGRTIYPKIGIWYHEPTEEIRIQIEGPKSATSVSNDPASVRYHKTLYERLARALEMAGVIIPPSTKVNSSSKGP